MSSATHSPQVLKTTLKMFASSTAEVLLGHTTREAIRTIDALSWLPQKQAVHCYYGKLGFRVDGFDNSLAHSPDSPPGNAGTKGKQTNKPGYPRFTALISAHHPYFIFRRFGRLRARLLLLKQDRLAVLERQLEDADQAEHCPLFLAKIRSDANPTRQALLAEIESRLADYDDFLEKTHRMLSYDSAKSRDVTSLRNWVDGTACLARNESGYLEERDLMTLGETRDNALSSIEDWVEDKLMYRYSGYRQRPLHDMSSDSNVFVYSGSLVKRTAKTLLLALIAFSLLTPAIVCNFVDNTAVRIAVIAIATVLFLALLSALTNSRSMELAIAGATSREGCYLLHSTGHAPYNHNACLDNRGQKNSQDGLRVPMIGRLARVLPFRPHQISSRASFILRTEPPSPLARKTRRLGWLGSRRTNTGHRHLLMEEEDRLPQLLAKGLDKLLANPAIKDYDVAENLSNHAFLVKGQYEIDGQVELLEMAIQLARWAVEAMPDDHAQKLFPLNNLAAMLHLLFVRTGDTTILADATRVCEQIVDGTLEDDDMWTGRASNLGVMYQSQYEASGDTSYLTKSIELMRRVVGVMSEDHWERSGLLSNLANQLSLLFKRHGDLAVGDEAIRFAQQAVDRCRPVDPEAPEWLNNLGITLHAHYERSGEARILELAIDACRKSVAQTPDTHVAMARRLNNLSNLLKSSFLQTGELDVMKESAGLAERAVNSTPDGLAERNDWLHNYAAKLMLLAEVTDNTSMMKTVVDLYRESLGPASGGDADHAVRLNSLGSALGKIAQKTGDTAARTEAVAVLQTSVDLTVKDHPSRGRWLLNLGGVLELPLHNVDGVTVPALPVDIDKALVCYVESFESLHTPPVDRITAARNAIRVLAQREAWERAGQVAESALQLLPIICGRQAAREDQQNAAARVSGLAADTCSLFLKLGDAAKAVQWLEFGRGLILGYMMDDRLEPAALSSLRQHHPALATHYDTLRLQAQTPVEAGDPAIDALRHQRWQAIRDMASCLTDIRKLDGFNNFLLEPEFGELAAQAVDGPIVVVNLTDMGSDAVIVTSHGADPVQLPKARTIPAASFLKRAYTRFGAARLALAPERDVIYTEADDGDDGIGEEELAWLWHGCVKPVVARMTEKGLLSPGGDDGPARVWWIGSGIATALPFHAARAVVATSDDGASTVESALAQMILSYAPTIKSLAYSRARAASSTVSKRASEVNRVLVVAMPTTPGQKQLRGAGREADAIKDIFAPLSPCQILRHPTAEQVLACIPASAIVHFACHGSADPMDPSRSRFILQKDGKGGPAPDGLTFSMISAATVTHDNSWLAFLSACSTAAVHADRLEEESLHLASAFQVAGFAHAVAALWPVDDDACTRLAALFYTHLTRLQGQGGYSTPASALRRATLQLQSEYPNRPSIWAPFIHIGA
ncbi:CHAT domain-containing protein [Dactylonectria estremocensis]|uniref:CHAT domain-containing protein n=1 Tax=Dactylonectria estremocensis TaxID=1079267 RepID=A0A9P9FC10_9HYPO|nr:CHAT domain-containing protein [Dactylonectria estremocensis]